MADESNGADFQDLNNTLRELITLLKTPSASRLNSNIASPLKSSSEERAKKLFRKAGGLAETIADFEKEITRHRGSVEGLTAVKKKINKFKNDLASIEDSLNSLKASGASSKYINKASEAVSRSAPLVTQYGRKIGGHLSQAIQLQPILQQKMAQEEALRKDHAEALRENRQMEKSALSERLKQQRSLDNAHREALRENKQRDRTSDNALRQQARIVDKAHGEALRENRQMEKSALSERLKQQRGFDSIHGEALRENRQRERVALSERLKQQRSIENAHREAIQDNKQRDRASVNALRQQARTVDRAHAEALREDKYNSAYAYQTELMENRAAYQSFKHPGFGYNPSALRKLIEEEKQIRHEFANETNLGSRQTLQQSLRENNIAQDRVRYEMSKGALFNIGGRPVGSNPREWAEAGAGAGLSKLAMSGRFGSMAAAGAQIMIGLVKGMVAATKLPAVISNFTGGILSGASPAVGIFQQSQLSSILGGGNRSDYRRWWHPEKASVYSRMLHTNHPMVIGPDEMNKLVGGMSLSGIATGNGLSERGAFARQLNNAVYYSSRMGGSTSIIPLIKQIASGAPGYNFKSSSAQVPDSFTHMFASAVTRHQDINGFLRSLTKSVATIQGGQNVSTGNIGGGLGALAIALRGYGGQSQYDVASTMSSLVGGEQSLHGGAFGDTAYTAGQMLFLQKSGGLAGLMKKGIYAKTLRAYGKLHPDMLKFGLDSPAGAMIFMRSALKNKALNYNYAVSSIAATGFPEAIQSLKLGSVTHLGTSAGDFIRRAIQKSPASLLSKQTLLKAHGNGTGVSPGTDTYTAMTAPVGQEMILFSSSLTSLVKSGVISKFQHQIGDLDEVVRTLTRGMLSLVHAIPIKTQ